MENAAMSDAAGASSASAAASVAAAAGNGSARAASPTQYSSSTATTTTETGSGSAALGKTRREGMSRAAFVDDYQHASAQVGRQERYVAADSWRHDLERGAAMNAADRVEFLRNQDAQRALRQDADEEPDARTVGHIEAERQMRQDEQDASSSAATARASYESLAPHDYTYPPFAGASASSSEHRQGPSRDRDRNWQRKRGGGYKHENTSSSGRSSSSRSNAKGEEYREAVSAERSHQSSAQRQDHFISESQRSDGEESMADSALTERNMLELLEQMGERGALLGDKSIPRDCSRGDAVAFDQIFDSLLSNEQFRSLVSKQHASAESASMQAATAEEAAAYALRAAMQLRATRGQDVAQQELTDSIAAAMKAVTDMTRLTKVAAGLTQTLTSGIYDNERRGSSGSPSEDRPWDHQHVQQGAMHYQDEHNQQYRREARRNEGEAWREVEVLDNSQDGTYSGPYSTEAAASSSTSAPRPLGLSPTVHVHTLRTEEGHQAAQGAGLGGLSSGPGGLPACELDDRLTGRFLRTVALPQGNVSSGSESNPKRTSNEESQDTIYGELFSSTLLTAGAEVSKNTDGACSVCGQALAEEEFDVHMVCLQFQERGGGGGGT
ncbi:hypothetical protein FVE85_2849 [Porphyridium purpureum]|uniref:Uncharacterized protein n=1 Tax=Porphyridium purpureum TaxID=35688 RepID=A0A5J4YTU8_PORPP|nr:hypothetical protein FVE85_2849 [Porphyridium purpureum]|eukprot:POR2694..scf227_4